jgi:hypothetical protein
MRPALRAIVGMIFAVCVGMWSRGVAEEGSKEDPPPTQTHLDAVVDQPVTDYPCIGCAFCGEQKYQHFLATWKCAPTAGAPPCPDWKCVAPLSHPKCIQVWDCTNQYRWENVAYCAAAASLECAACAACSQGDPIACAECVSHLIGDVMVGIPEMCGSPCFLMTPCTAVVGSATWQAGVCGVWTGCGDPPGPGPKN